MKKRLGITIIFAFVLALVCSVPALAADYSYTATAGDTVVLRASPNFLSTVTNLTHGYSYIDGSPKMSGLSTRISVSDTNSSEHMAVLGGKIPDDAFGTYKYRVNLKYDYKGESHTFDYDVNITVKAAPNTEISLVKITGIDTPVVGAKPDTTCSLSAGVKSATITWQEAPSSGSFVTMSTSTFRAGYRYRCKFVLTLNSGYTWSGSTTTTGTSYLDGTIYLNGKMLNGNPAINNATKELTHFSSVTELKKSEISEVKITGIDKPVIGAKPDTTCTLPANMESASVTWQEAQGSGGYKTMTTSTFQTGYKYRCNVSLTPNSGYTWKLGSSSGSAGYYKFGGTASIFDETIPDGYADTTPSNQLILISKVFELKAATEPSGPSTAPSKPVITKQPQDVNSFSGGDATFTIAASGEGLHYQWWCDSLGTPEKVGSDSPTYSIIQMAVVMNHSNVWCVVSNSAGEVTSQKATLVLSGDPYRFPFTDVPSSQWYYQSVKGAHQMGLIDGKTATLYKPADNMTYAEAIKLAACMHQLYTDGEVTLTNGSSKWYSTYYDYCRDNGIIPATTDLVQYGYNDLLTRANTIITRAQYALIFSRALPDEALADINDIPNNSIPDVSLSISVYNQAIYKLYRAGIVNGMDSKGTFKPDSNIQRSEVATILIRMMDPSARVGAPSELEK